MRRSRRELKARWLARHGSPATADQPLRDDPAELNPKKRRGPPPGNQNRRIHGVYSRERRAFFAEVRAFLAEGKTLAAAVNEAFGPARERDDGGPDAGKHQTA
jgi:hypothetical protein